MVLFVEGTWVWYEHPKESWIPVQMVSQTGDEILCKSQIGEHHHINVKDNLETAHPSSLKEVDNMVNLLELTEGCILHDLRLRYEQSKIYTYISEIVISINPYKMLSYYGPSTIEEYREKLSLREKVPPHVYALADNAYKNLCMDRKSQAVIISGESGAGKTEATKLVLQYLAEVSGQGADIEQQILEANPIIEAFGNAKTVRNDNSSRFGKWIEIMFNESNFIYGSKIYNYLLEKSRVVSQATGERNYHAFYQMCVGASEVEKKKWSIAPANKFRLLSGGKCWNVEGTNDAENYNRVRDAMNVLDFSPTQQEQVFRALACIMHLGNIEFEQKGDKAMIANPEALETSANLLCVDMVGLGKALLARIIKVMKDYISKFLTAAEARDGRDAFCKALYDRVFNWLIAKINQTLYRPAESYLIIGVLDIFGFEIFEENYYEQFCINFANEKLQQHFTQHVFSMEQREYAAEDVPVEAVTYVDNQACLDLIEKKHTGILSMISEETRLPKGSDKNLLERMHLEHKDCEYYLMPKTKGTSFTIKHYAGNVTYTITGFTEKDKDTLNGDLAKVCISSSDDFLNQLFGEDDLAGLDMPKPKEEATTKRGRKVQKPVPTTPTSPTTPRARGSSNAASTMRGALNTLGTQFKTSLAELMQTIQNCGPHFIRCIKPNSKKIPDEFDAQLIVRQMRYLGLKEVVAIRQRGYPVRRSHDSFLKRYRMLVPGFKYDEDKVTGEDCRRFLHSLHKPDFSDGEWATGKTKVFMKLRVQAELERRREETIQTVVVRMQAIYRAKAAYQRFIQKKVAKERLEQAMGNKEIEELEKSISLAEATEVSMALIADARKLLNYLVDVKQAKAALVAAYSSPSRDLEMLTTAITRAEELELKPDTCSELKSVKDLLEALQQYFKEMTEAVEKKDIAALKKALSTAESLLLNSEREANANELLERLQSEEAMIAKLEEAMKQRELTAIILVIEEAEELGLKEGYPLQKSHLDAARTLRKRLELEKQVRDDLKLAMAARDVGIIETALKECEEAKMTEEEDYKAATVLRETLLREATVAEATAVLKSALESKNFKILELAVKAAKEKELQEDPLTKQAEEMMVTISKNNEILQRIQLALDSRTLETLTSALKEAEDAKLSSWGMAYQLAETRAQKLKKMIEQAQKGLEEALKSSDVKAVEGAVETAVKVGSHPLDELIEKAKKHKTFLYEKNARLQVLKTALDSKDEALLNNALERATAHGHFQNSDAEIKQAREVLNTLVEERILREQELAAAKAAAEEESRQKEEAERRQKAEEQRRRQEEEERIKREEEEEERRKKEQEELKKREEEARKRLEEERKKRETAEAQRREEEEKKLKEENEKRRLEAEKAGESDREKIKQELDEKEKEERARLEEERRKRGEDEKKQRVQEEKERERRRQEDEQRRRLDEERRREEEDRRKKDEAAAKQNSENKLVGEEEGGGGGGVSDDDEEEGETKETESQAVKESEAVREVPKFDPNLYKPSKFNIHLFPKLRTPDSFSRGALFNKKKLTRSMLKFSKEVIPRSLTRMAAGGRDKSKKKLLDKTAVQLFKSLQGVMGDRHYSFPDALALEILETGLKEPALRDEIYLQIVKQTSDNPRPESVVRGWQMMGLCAETFPPTDTMLYHLYHYILRNLDDPEHPAKDYIGYCLRTLQQARPPLLIAPNIEHVIAFKERLMKSDHVVITFPDGSELELDIDPAMDLATLLPQVKLKIKLKEPGFGIFQVGPRSEFRIHENECLLDFEAAKSKDRSVRFLLKKHMYYKRGRTKDPVALSIIYHQAIVDVCTGMFEVSREDKIQILAVHKVLVEKKYFSPIGRENTKAMEAVRNIGAITASTLPESERKEFLASVDSAAETHEAAGCTPENAISIIRKYPVWGSQFYNVQQDDQSLPNLVLGVNLIGVFLLDAATRKTLKKFAYGHLNGWANNSVKFCLRVLVSKGQTMQFNLITKQGKRIHQTMQENINHLVRAMERKKKKKKAEEGTASTPGTEVAAT